MFGKVNAERLVKRKKWNDLRHAAERGDKETLIQIAEQCGTVTADEAYNILVNMLENSDVEVRTAAVRALGKMGKETAATHIRRIMMHEENASGEIVEVIHTALSEIKSNSR